MFPLPPTHRTSHLYTWHFGKRARMIMWWLRRGKTCNSRFVHKVIFFLFFFSSYITFWNFLYINQTWIKTCTTPHPADMAFSYPKSHILRFCFPSPKSMLQPPETSLRSTTPACPRWHPPQRKAWWGPPCARSTPPLSSCQLRCAETTSRCSSSSADHRPPETGRRRSGEEVIGEKDERKEVSRGSGCGWKRGGCGGRRGKQTMEMKGDDMGKRDGQFVNQSTRWGCIYLLAQRNRICLNLHLTQSPQGCNEAPGFNTLHFPAAGGGALC